MFPILKFSAGVFLTQLFQEESLRNKSDPLAPEGKQAIDCVCTSFSAVLWPVGVIYPPWGSRDTLLRDSGGSSLISFLVNVTL